MGTAVSCTTDMGVSYTLIWLSDTLSYGSLAHSQMGSDILIWAQTYSYGWCVGSRVGSAALGCPPRR
eukprot:2129717-Rhodomonas_salina.4